MIQYNCVLIAKLFELLDQDTVERTIESAALEYFDSASDITDKNSLDMCMKCLSMKPGSKYAQSIRDLVEALSLLSAMGLQNRLPAEIRREEDRIEVLRWVFEVNPVAYVRDGWMVWFG